MVGGGDLWFGGVVNAHSANFVMRDIGYNVWSLDIITVIHKLHILSNNLSNH